MKSRMWAGILVLLLVLCGISGYFLITPGSAACTAEITSGGEVIRAVDLAQDQEFTVTTEDGGYNVITVRDGMIAVTEASCPDHYCMHRGFCDGGTEIVCLPNKLIIRFLGEQEVDAALG